jgi:lysophospholipase L1-like esterase
LKVVAAALLLCAGCRLLSPPEVALVGDSLLNEATDEAEAASDEDVTIRSFPGITVAQGAGLVDEAVATDPDVLVVELGTNDAMGRTDLGSIDAVLDSAGGVECVVWVTVAERHEGAREINAHLAEQADARDNLRLVRWDQEVADHPEWYVQDGIHHTEAGQVAFAEAISAGIEDCLG